MNTEILITLVILLCAVVFYSTTWMNMTATSLLILAALYLSGIVSVSELFVNLVNSSTLLVIFMFIISGCLLYTSLITWKRTIISLFSADGMMSRD